VGEGGGGKTDLGDIDAGESNSGSRQQLTLGEISLAGGWGVEEVDFLDFLTLSFWRFHKISKRSSFFGFLRWILDN
jgi:hypothetical protein